jgi:hypothetical protein
MLVATVPIALFASLAAVVLWNHPQVRPHQQGVSHAPARRRSF